jgi:hypothetical protein
MLSGMSSPQGSPCILHEVVLPATIHQVESGKNIQSVKEGRGGLRYTQQPLYNLWGEDKDFVCIRIQMTAGGHNLLPE